MREEPSNKSVYYVSLGCAKAQVDAEAAVGHLLRDGYTLCDTPQDADLAVVNTCSFIQPAIEESLDAIVALEALRDDGELRELVVAGCLVDRFGDDLPPELPGVDRFLPSHAFRDWARQRPPNTAGASPGPALPMAADPRVRFGHKHHAYVKIAEGCDRTCAFCAIPSIRGKQRSRPADDIARELQQWWQDGVQEAALVSQDTIRWGRDLSPSSTLPELLAELAAAPAEIPPWIRLHYLYPERSVAALAPYLAHGGPIVPYVDMPIQHAADGVLRSMRRAHRQDDIRRAVAALREANPEIALRTTVLVGHPGETAADVDTLIAELETLRFDAVGVFPYWREAGTRAFDLADHLGDEERQARAAAVETAALEIAEDVAARRIGTQLTVLVDGRDELDGAWVGRHAGQALDVDGLVLLEDFHGPPGEFIEVEVTDTRGIDLVARPLVSMDPLRVL